ncbi:hypothetical protein [Thiocapsa sp.]|nr:hypothetical protein [Thiocapsa sp.]
MEAIPDNLGLFLATLGSATLLPVQSKAMLVGVPLADAQSSGCC